MRTPTDAQRVTIRKQLRQIGAAREILVDCGGCGNPKGLTNLYRCFECGVYFCVLCGPEHWPEAARNRRDFEGVEAEPGYHNITPIEVQP